MTLGKVLPFKRVVVLLFFGSISVGSVLFIRAFTEMKSSSKLKDKLRHDDIESSEDLHLKRTPAIEKSQAESLYASGKIFLNNIASGKQFSNNDMKVDFEEEEKTDIAFVVEKESTGYRFKQTKQPASEKTTEAAVYIYHVSTPPTLNLTKTPPQITSIPTTKTPTTLPIPTINPKFKDYGESGCRENSLRGLFIELLTEWSKLAAQENITYFLYSGSLLGQARNEDIIPYDLDVDVVIEYQDFSKLQKISQPRRFSPGDGKFHLVVQPEYLQKNNMDDRKRYSCSGKSVPHLMDSCSFVEPMGRLIKNYNHVDIFTFIDKGEKILVPVDYKDIYYKRDVVFPIQDCRFMGIQNVHCPRNVVAVLEGYFGKNLTPSKKCRGGKWRS